MTNQFLLFVLSAVSLWADGRITGVVIDQARGPIAGTKVLVIAESGEKSEAAADLEGRFTISNLRAGTYSIEISHPGFLSKTISTVKVRAGEETRAEDVTLTVGPIPRCEGSDPPVAVFTPIEPGHAELAGRIFLGNAKPFYGALVTLYELDSNRRIRSTQTNANGRFKIADLRPGTYRLRVVHRGFAGIVVDAVEVQEGWRSEATYLTLTPCPRGKACPATKWTPPAKICL